MAIGQIELAFRVAVGSFVILAPTLLFLGLWKGLMRLRDEALIERVRRMEGHGSPSPATSPVTASAAGAIDENQQTGVDCEACGASNLGGMRYCRECFGTLPDE